MRAAERATPMELSEEMAAEAAEAEVAAAVGDGGISEYLKTNKRLFGGAQYWRALQEFSIGATQGWSSRERRIVDGELSDEEILNAMGFDGIDGVNYMRAVCVTAIERGAGYFEPQLALKTRLLHIMRRLPARRGAARRRGGGQPQRSRGARRRRRPRARRVGRRPRGVACHDPRS